MPLNSRHQTSYLSATPAKLALRAGCSATAIAAAMFLFGTSTVARAQTVTASKADELSEVIVTARRREESLEKVPVAEVALSNDALSEPASRTSAI